MGMTIDQELAEISDLALKIQADYLTMLKAEKVAILTELQLEIEELPMYYDPRDVSDLIQQKINSLKENKGNG